MEPKSSFTCNYYKKSSNIIRSQNLVIAVVSILIFTFSTRPEPTKSVLQIHHCPGIYENNIETIKIVSHLKLRHYQTLRWPFFGMSLNKIMHMLIGNRRLGYNLAVWNCRKGLVDTFNNPTMKLMDVKLLLQQHDLHVLGLVESDLHGVDSRIKRRNPISTKEITEGLQIAGYSIQLPSSWYVHGQARIILYVKDGVTFKLRNLKPL